MKSILIVAISLFACGGGFATEPMPAWDRVDDKDLSFFKSKGFEFRVDDCMAHLYEKPTVEICIFIPDQFADTELKYKFYSILFLSEELAADLGVFPASGKQRSTITISRDMVKKSQIIFYFKNDTKTATEGTQFVLDLSKVLSDWESSQKDSAKAKDSEKK